MAIDLLSKPDLFPGVFQLLFLRELVPDLFPVAHRVIGAERNDPPVGHQNAHAALHDLFHVEGVGVHEILDGDLEYVVFQVRQLIAQFQPRTAGALELVRGLF